MNENRSQSPRGLVDAKDGERTMPVASRSGPCGCCLADCPTTVLGSRLSRRSFLQGVSCGAAGAALAGWLASPAPARAAAAEPVPGTPHPRGSMLRVKPAIIAKIPTRQEKTSWRWYGGIQTMDEVHGEAQRLEQDLRSLATRSDFPVEFLPMAVVSDEAQAKETASGEHDVLLIFGACSYDQALCHQLAAGKAPAVLFLRHRTEPHYCQHVTAHIVFLRQWTDSVVETNMDVHDVAVDDYNEILWRLRALYGLKNSIGTTMLAIGGLQHYSAVGGKHAPKHAEVWRYRIETVPLEEFAGRLNKARTERQLAEAVERQTSDLLAQPNVTLKTDRKFVFNSLLALWVSKELAKEKGATNFGFAGCMGNAVITLLDTPPCLILALANDEGYTAYCHADLTHTTAGVLLRWIASRPTFVCNSHFPHDGIYTVAHCAAPRKMNGKDCEPTDIMTHYESDYGAATKVHYAKGQTVTVVIPALDCTKWQGFRGKIVESPSRPACRSQMDIAIEGNWRRLLTEEVGFHVQVVYGDYLREVGYALKKLGKIQWENFSEVS